MEQNKIAQQWSKMVLKDVSFVNLMQHRIYNVLIVANPYDAFMLEDDGRVDEKVFNEYTSLGLRYPPLFRQVSTTEEAAEVLRTTNIDLASSSTARRMCRRRGHRWRTLTSVVPT